MIARLRTVLGWALVVLTAVGLYMSWGNLYDLAVACGMPPERAVMFPVVIDVVTVVAMLLAILPLGLPRAAAVYPWVALGVFGLATVGGNALHVLTAASGTITVNEWIAVVANSMPAIALLLTTHLAAVTVYRQDADTAEVGAEANVLASLPDDATVADAVASVVDATIEADGKKPMTREERRQLVHALRTDGLSPAQIHRETGIPTSTISRYLNPAH
jgi:uncharacterized protein YerC